MAKFSEVFSTTLKVWTSVLLISLAGGAIYLFFAAASKVGTVGNPDSTANVDPWAADYSQADDVHTKMPKSKWDKMVAAAIKQHCALEGMSEQEVERALGKATKVDEKLKDCAQCSGDTWTYESTDKGSCEKYDGDNCVQYAQHTDIIFFSRNGYKTLGSDGGGCMKEPLFSMRLSAGLE